ncbi:3567_t:CDS:2 [Funneliformis geosporum]|uniref:19225_t:CDS:1 n=1 Tax=Funneliformis geosporum TaxID=1117311 RepID=A0A9W4SUH2_9GLOM|nr:3567_t:CDS:2 [Funneliformis geosporum]CAI2179524.1 19225_t:CDS:2 [Funneliformis geosporum]
MTSVSSSPNGANKPWFCTSERLHWEFFGQRQKGTLYLRADGPQEANKKHKHQEANKKQSSALLTNKPAVIITSAFSPNHSAKNERTSMKRITRTQKNQSARIEGSETNTTKMQIDKDEQYVEQEHIQLEEDLILEGEALEPEPPLHDSPGPIITDSQETKESPKSDDKRTENDNNSEEAEESNEKSEAVKSEDDADGDDEGGISIRKFTRSTRSSVISTQKKPQTRKSQRKATRSKDEESENIFKGRDIVFVDPLDDKAEFWWPAMIVPNNEIDESMDVDGKLEENLLAGKFLVRYFEDMTYSVVEQRGLKHFIPDEEPYLSFKNNCDKFSSHIGVRRALQCKGKGEPNKSFKWDYWKRPIDENQVPIPVPTTTSNIKRRTSTASTSKSGSKSNYKSLEVEVIAPSRIRPRKTKSPVRRNSSSTRSKSSITNIGNNSSQASHEGEPSEEESAINVYIENPTKPPSLDRRRTSESENNDFLTNNDTIKDSNDNMEAEIVDEEEEKKSNKSSKRRRSSLTDKSDDGEQNSNNDSRNRKIKRTSDGESMDEEPTVLPQTSPDTTSAMVETIVEVPMEIAENLIESSTEPEHSEQIEQGNEPLIEIIEEENVPSTAPLTSPPLTSPPLTIEDLSEEAQINIAKFNFDDPTLDPEAKEKLYDDAEEELRSLMKEWRLLNRHILQVVTRSLAQRKMSEDTKMSKGKRTKKI